MTVTDSFSTAKRGALRGYFFAGEEKAPTKGRAKMSRERTTIVVALERDSDPTLFRFQGFIPTIPHFKSKFSTISRA